MPFLCSIGETFDGPKPNLCEIGLCGVDSEDYEDPATTLTVITTQIQTTSQSITTNTTSSTTTEIPSPASTTSTTTTATVTIATSSVLLFLVIVIFACFWCSERRISPSNQDSTAVSEVTFELTVH